MEPGGVYDTFNMSPARGEYSESLPKRQDGHTGARSWESVLVGRRTRHAIPWGSREGNREDVSDKEQTE